MPRHELPQSFEPGSIYVSMGEDNLLIVGPGEDTVDRDQFNLKGIEDHNPTTIQLPDGSTLLVAVTDHTEKDASDTPGAWVAVEMTVQGLAPMVWHGKIQNGGSEDLFDRIMIVHKE